MGMGAPVGYRTGHRPDGEGERAAPPALSRPAPPVRPRPARRRRPGAGSGAAGPTLRGSGGSAMVGRLSLREVPDLPDMRKRGDTGLDSPDSGLPPSPGPAPPPWLLSSGSPDRAVANGLPEPEPPAPAAAVSTGTSRRRCPGERRGRGTARRGTRDQPPRGTRRPRARSRCGRCWARRPAERRSRCPLEPTAGTLSLLQASRSRPRSIVCGKEGGQPARGAWGGRAPGRPVGTGRKQLLRVSLPSTDGSAAVVPRSAPAPGGSRPGSGVSAAGPGRRWAGGAGGASRKPPAPGPGLADGGEAPGSPAPGRGWDIIGFEDPCGKRTLVIPEGDSE